MSDAVLVLNAGSSSIKLGLFDISTSDPVLLCKGLLDEHQLAPRIEITGSQGEILIEPKRSAPDSNGLLADVLTAFENYLGDDDLHAVGHRVVHGGPDYSGPVKLDQSVLSRLESLTPLAPLHQPRCLAPIRTFQSLRPELTQIACFDTAFHHGLAPPASRFAIPRRFEDSGVRRYGFHGLSFEYIAGRLADMSPQLAAMRTVVAHLGNGASLCALRDGRSIDTTMGLTPLDGLVMGTRCGAIDPGVLLYLQQHEKLSLEEVQHLLYNESGLLGVSGISSDMRTLLRSSGASAREAIDIFTYRVAQQVAAMANALGGLECLVFTGGIGEHSAEIRAEIGERLRWLGVRLNRTANETHRERIGDRESTVETFVIPTNEEMAIATHCAALLRVSAPSNSR